MKYRSQHLMLFPSHFQQCQQHPAYQRIPARAVFLHLCLCSPPHSHPPPPSPPSSSFSSFASSPFLSVSSAFSFSSFLLQLHYFLPVFPCTPAPPALRCVLLPASAP